MSENDNANRISVTVDSEMDVDEKPTEMKKSKKGMKNCVFITLIIILAVIAIGLLIGLIIVAVKKDDDKNSKVGNLGSEESEVGNIVAKASQVEEKQKISVEWNIEGEADNVTVSVYHNGRLYSSKTIKEDNKKIGSNTTEVDGMYGKVDVLVSASFSNYALTHNVSVNLSSSIYNMAAIGASYPVSLFSVIYPQLTENGKIPTFVWLERSSQYNWESLPEELQEYPIMTEEDKYGGDFNNAYLMIADWVKELHEINPNSYFHMYYHDYYIYGAVNSTYGVGLPKDKFYLHILTDGDMTSQMISSLYNKPDTAQSIFDGMQNEWKTFKDEISSKGCYDFIKNDYSILAINVRFYCTIMSYVEDNVNYFITATNPAPNNQEFINSLKRDDCLKVLTLKDELDKLNESQKEDLKKMFSFSSEVFEAAGENKKIMILIGKKDANEVHLYEFIKLMKYLYKDEFVYYYKGHPVSPTVNCEGKLEKLTEAGMIDLDSTIPFEVIHFFRPDVYTCGYGSSSFNSISKEYVYSVFNTKKSYAYDDDGNFKTSISNYYSLFDSFITFLAKDDGVYGSYAEYDNNYLVEYVSNSEVDFTVYNIDNLDSHKHYKKNAAGTYEEVQLAGKFQELISFC